MSPPTRAMANERATIVTLAKVCMNDPARWISKVQSRLDEAGLSSPLDVAAQGVSGSTPALLLVTIGLLAGAAVDSINAVTVPMRRRAAAGAGAELSGNTSSGLHMRRRAAAGAGAELSGNTSSGLHGAVPGPPSYRSDSGSDDDGDDDMRFEDLRSVPGGVPVDVGHGPDPSVATAGATSEVGYFSCCPVSTGTPADPETRVRGALRAAGAHVPKGASINENTVTFKKQSYVIKDTKQFWIDNRKLARMLWASLSECEATRSAMMTAGFDDEARDGAALWICLTQFLLDPAQNPMPASAAEEAWQVLRQGSVSASGFVAVVTKAKNRIITVGIHKTEVEIVRHFKRWCSDQTFQIIKEGGPTQSWDTIVQRINADRTERLLRGKVKPPPQQQQQQQKQQQQQQQQRRPVAMVADAHVKPLCTHCSKAGHASDTCFRKLAGMDASTDLWSDPKFANSPHNAARKARRHKSTDERKRTPGRSAASASTQADSASADSDDDNVTFAVADSATAVREEAMQAIWPEDTSSSVDNDFHYDTERNPQLRIDWKLAFGALLIMMVGFTLSKVVDLPGVNGCDSLTVPNLWDNWRTIVIECAGADTRALQIFALTSGG